MPRLRLLETRPFNSCVLLPRYRTTWGRAPSATARAGFVGRELSLGRGPREPVVTELCLPWGEQVGYRAAVAFRANTPRTSGGSTCGKGDG